MDPGLGAAHAAETVSLRDLEPPSPVGLGRGQF